MYVLRNRFLSRQVSLQIVKSDIHDVTVITPFLSATANVNTMLGLLVMASAAGRIDHCCGTRPGLYRTDCVWPPASISGSSGAGSSKWPVFPPGNPSIRLTPRLRRILSPAGGSRDSPSEHPSGTHPRPRSAPRLITPAETRHHHRVVVASTTGPGNGDVGATVCATTSSLASSDEWHHRSSSSMRCAERLISRSVHVP